MFIIATGEALKKIELTVREPEYQRSDLKLIDYKDDTWQHKTGENRIRRISRTKYTVDPGMRDGARRRIKRLPERFILYPEPGLEYLKKTFFNCSTEQVLIITSISVLSMNRLPAE